MSTSFQGERHVREIVTTYPSGQVRKEYQYIDTSFLFGYSKVPAILPKYVPGQFLVKDYSVLSFRSQGDRENLKSSYTRPDGVRFDDNYKLSGYCYTPMLNFASVAPPDVSALKALSLQQAYNKLNRPHWDSLVDLAEIGGTFDLVKDGLKLLASPAKVPRLLKNLNDFLFDKKAASRVGKRVRDLSWKDVRETGEKGAKSAADLWLTYRYGIMPLVYSIQDALELLKAELSKAGKQIRTVRRRPGKVDSESTRRIAAPRCTVVTKWSSRVEAIVYYKRTADETLESALGLVPENLPNAFWETCKLSFVWDWFFNVGDFISTLKPKFGIDVLGTSVSERHTGEISVIQSFATMRAGTYVTAKPHKCVYDSFKRTANPALSFTPVFTALDDMNLKRYTDSAALALQPILNNSKKARSALR